MSGEQSSVCIPSTASTGQHIRVVVKYLNEHPAELHLPEFTLVERALREAYPCQ